VDWEHEIRGGPVPQDVGRTGCDAIVHRLHVQRADDFFEYTYDTAKLAHERGSKTSTTLTIIVPTHGTIGRTWTATTRT
jgi:hypothetical protein